MAVSTVRRSSAPLATKSSKSDSSVLLTAHSAIEVPTSTKLQTTITRWRLHCGLCSGETLQTPLCIYLDLSQRFSEFLSPTVVVTHSVFSTLPFPGECLDFCFATMPRTLPGV